MTTKAFAIKHTPTGLYLHIQRFDANDQMLLTMNVQESWCGPEAQAVVLASILEPVGEFVAAQHSERQDLIYRLRKRAEIRRQIPSRKSGQEGKSDRLADLLDEAADALEQEVQDDPP